MIRRGNWKLHQYFEDGGLELYNLKQDPGETKNLAQSSPNKTKELLNRLKDWQTEIKAPIPSKANPEFDAAAEKAAIELKETPLTRK